MTVDPTARTLQLLTLLQSRSEWPSSELCHRLGVSARTLRRDVQRLRGLGYALRAAPGPGAVYRLVPGVDVPPLLFTADEVAVVVSGLRLAGQHMDGVAAASALAKLDQVLPPRLRRRAAATDLATEVLDDITGVSASEVGLLADAVAEGGRVRFTYTDQHGRTATRVTEPFRHILRGVHWYLVAFDVDRDDWRTFRFDRMSALQRVPGVFAHRPFPADTVRRWFDTDFGRQEVRQIPPGATSSNSSPS